MAAKELKALIEVGTSLGYTGDELKQFVNDERMRVDREREKEDEKNDKRRNLNALKKSVWRSRRMKKKKKIGLNVWKDKRKKKKNGEKN